MASHAQRFRCDKAAWEDREPEWAPTYQADRMLADFKAREPETYARLNREWLDTEAEIEASEMERRRLLKDRAKPATCSICGRGFSNASGLHDHRRDKHGLLDATGGLG